MVECGIDGVPGVNGGVSFVKEMKEQGELGQQTNERGKTIFRSVDNSRDIVTFRGSSHTHMTAPP